jgi:beta-N-acetylhexosaminidase
MPFKSLAHSNWPVMIMTAHVINRALDHTGLPATLSRTILTDLLRNELGFKGVIVSDDLQMRAIANHYSLEESLRLTINAGADMLIFGNQLGHHTATEVIDQVENLVNAGAIEEARIDEAWQRIAFLKHTIM